VAEALGVGARRVVDRLDDLAAERVARLAGQAVHVHQPVEGAGAGQVVVVDVDAGIGEEPVARHVVLVAVRVDDGVDRHRRSAAGDDGDRRVDDDRLAGAAHEQRIDGRVLAAVGTDQHRHRGGERPLVVTPGDGRRQAGRRSRLRLAELMQYRWPVGGGPSGNTWPRWAPQLAQRTSVRTMPWLWSSRYSILPSAIAS